MSTKKYVYLPLMGRIGNQLFEYAMGYVVQREFGAGTELIIDDSEVLDTKWINSLREYDLPDVVYESRRDNSYWNNLGVGRLAYKVYNRFFYNRDPQILYAREKKYQKLLNKCGLIAVAKGYADYKINTSKNALVCGYFQSEKFFSKYKNDIKKIFDLTEKLYKSGYPNIEQIESRNTVCISIKVEHNLGSDIYDVCGEDYYREAIDYIISKVDNPLFFLCSDNVAVAREKFFSDFKGDVVCQPDGYSVSLSLCAMSKCKHFIINNTSYGWWAQYLSDNEKKIVVAPSRWMNNTDPVSIYDNQENWHLIEV